MDTQISGSKHSITTTPEETDQDEPQPKRRQVFGRTTYDSTVKYVFQDESVRLSFVNAFVKPLISRTVTNTRPISEFLTPVKSYTTIRELLYDQQIVQLMKDAHRSLDNAVVCFKDGDLYRPYDALNHQKKAHFVHSLSACYDNLLDLVPPIEKQAQVDILCQIDNREYIVVEVQVAKQDHWDARSLAYASYTYSNQMKRGTTWPNIKSVIAINILGGGPKNIRPWEQEGKPYRHYKFVDIYDHEHTIPQLQILQFSLPNAELEPPEKIDQYITEKPGMLEWLTYFKTAHLQETIPDGIDTGLQRAYQMATLQDMTSTFRAAYETEDKLYSKFTEYTESVKAEGKAEGKVEGKAEGKAEGKEEGKAEGRQEAKIEIARTMLLQNRAINDIREITGLSEETLETVMAETKMTTTSNLSN